MNMKEKVLSPSDQKKSIHIEQELINEILLEKKKKKQDACKTFEINKVIC